MAGAVPQLCPDRADSMARPAISTCVSPIFSGQDATEEFVEQTNGERGIAVYRLQIIP